MPRRPTDAATAGRPHRAARLRMWEVRPLRVRGSLPPLLRDAPFRRYWTGRSLSEFGGQIHGVALPLTAVLVLHAGPTAMSLVAAAGSAPSLVASAHLGPWVDRRGRRHQLMLVADLGRAALVAAVPVLWALGLLSIAVLIALSLGLGTLGVLFRVSAGTLFVSLVPRQRYVAANALLSQGRAAVFLLGPGARRATSSRRSPRRSPWARTPSRAWPRPSRSPASSRRSRPPTARAAATSAPASPPSGDRTRRARSG